MGEEIQKKIIKKRFSIGSDPEFFLICMETGKLLSAIPFIKGTKHEPEELEGGGTFQQDNVAAEFATPPAYDREDFVGKVRRCFIDIKKKLPNHCKIAILPSAVFDDDQLDCDAAKEFGCEPDFNAWTVEINEKPDHPNKNFRSCGGHVHIGHVEGDGNGFLLDPYGKIETTKGMDVFAGLISVVLDKSKESIERRKLYGSSGCHRPTIYGVEYRVLSNYWMKSPELVMLIESLTHDVLESVKAKTLDKIIEEIGENEIQTIIDQGKVEEAIKAIDKVLMPHLSEDSKHYYNVCSEKIDTYDFIKEWKLEGEANAA